MRLAKQVEIFDRDESAEGAINLQGIKKFPLVAFFLAIFLADIAVLLSVGLGSLYLYAGTSFERYPYHIWGFVLSVVGFMAYGVARKLYSDIKYIELRDAFPRFMSGIIYLSFIFFFVHFMLQEPILFSRFVYIAFLFFGVIGLSVVRLVASWAKQLMISGQYAVERSFLVSDRSVPRSLSSSLEIASGGRIRIVATLVKPSIHQRESVKRLLKDSKIDSVIFVADSMKNLDSDDFFQMLQKLSAGVYFAYPQELLPGEVLRVIDNGDTVLMQTARQPIEGWGASQKRALDIALSCTLLVLASPVLLLSAFAIRMNSPGPILFRQKRFGLNNTEFTMLKFRTMTWTNGTQSDSQTRADDARITRVGRVLRKLKLDELPQLVNVLLGDMSIVGPRAHATRTLLDGVELAQHEIQYLSRHRVKPGMTSWAIVNGCSGAMDSPAKLRRTLDYDLYYSRHWSIWFDIGIIFMTFLSIIGLPLGRERQIERN